MSTATDRYRKFRSQTNAQSTRLEQLHCHHLTCKPGCHECCVNLTVFPVEFYAILEDLKQLGTDSLKLDESASCAFLSQGLCTIYSVRPTICRTHGLPVAFLNDAAEEPEMSVSFCPKNFTQASEDDLAFGSDSTLDLDALNMELYQLNLDFIEEHPELNLSPSDRIPLKQLATALRQ